MIHLFRKIRQNLLSENKTGEYLKYAVGEIFLVVVGILIALAINNWNDDRINTGKQQDYLNGLKNDLEKQIISFNASIEFYDFLIRTGESILEDFSLTGNISAIADINKKLSYLMFTQKYPEITTTFNELNSTGQFNLIKDKTLRSQIIKYYQNSKNHEETVTVNLEHVIYTQIFPIIKSTVIIRPEDFNIQNEKIHLVDHLKTAFENNLSNSQRVFELINTISLRIIVAKGSKISIEEAKNEAELLLDRINNELIVH